MKRIRGLLAYAVLFATAFLLAGCGGGGALVIKDTTGLEKYLTDQGRCEYLAKQVKEDFPEKNSPQYRKAKKMFDETANTGNAWIETQSMEIQSKGIVDINEATYRNSEAGKSMSSFLAIETDLYRSETKRVAWILPVQVIDWGFKIVDLVLQHKGESSQDAGRVLPKQFQRAHWTSFDNINQAWLDKKYMEAPEEEVSPKAKPR